MKSKNCQWLLWPVFVLNCIVVLHSPVRAQAGFPFLYGDQVIYYPKLSSDTASPGTVKLRLADAMRKAAQLFDVASGKIIIAKDIRSVSVSDQAIVIDVKGKGELLYTFTRMQDSTFFFFSKPGQGNFVFIPSLANFAFSYLQDAQSFADQLYRLQYPRIDRVRDSLLRSFQLSVDSFRKSGNITSVKTEQQELFNAADSAAEKGEYFEAIRRYNQALSINEFSFPQAYSNLALLYAQVNFFDYAIYCMKKYLLLQPNEMASRSARDKIYEWEGIIHY